MRIRRWMAVGVLAAVPVLSAPEVVLPSAEAHGEQVVLGSCTGVVTGPRGAEVLVSPAAVLDPVVSVLDRVDLLDGVVQGLRVQWQAVPAIPVGHVGDGVLSGDRIADATLGRLAEVPALRGVLHQVVPALRGTLSTACGIVTEVAGPLLPPAAEPAPPPSVPPPPPPPSAPEIPQPAPAPPVEVVPGPPMPAADVPVSDEVAGLVEPGAAGIPVMTRTTLAAGRTSISPGIADSPLSGRAGPSWVILTSVIVFAFALGNWVRSMRRPD